MPDVPIGPIGDAIGQAIGSMAASAFDSAMKSLWDFSISLLGGVFGVVDHLTTPNLDPRSGPLASVLPGTLWIGAVLLVLLSFLQVGKAAMTGGAGLLHLMKGIGQYIIVTAGGLGVLAAAVTAANAAALGILGSGLHVTSWQGITTSNSAWQNSVNGVSGAGLGLIALLGVLPASISLLLAVLVREAAILVIAATIPIVAAGLVAEATARWFWTAVRWLLALVLLTPVVAIVMALGLHLAAGGRRHQHPHDLRRRPVRRHRVHRRGSPARVGLLPPRAVQAPCLRRPWHRLGATVAHLDGGRRNRRSLIDLHRRRPGRLERFNPAGSHELGPGRDPVGQRPRPTVHSARDPGVRRPARHVHCRTGSRGRRRRRRRRPRLDCARCRPGDEPRAAGKRGGSDVNTTHRRAAQST